ncbi:MAG: hypothetical protein NC238_02860 [Dehalobacter sp.]|nr:hypothetical protein [Dehalobacter sp.]
MPEIFLRVTMPDQSKWDVPAKIIADNRAAYYAKIDPETTYEEEFEFTMTDDHELRDWAANNMDWDEVSEHAEKVIEETSIDFQEGWLNGEKVVIEK